MAAKWVTLILLGFKMLTNNEIITDFVVLALTLAQFVSLHNPVFVAKTSNSNIGKCYPVDYINVCNRLVGINAL